MSNLSKSHYIQSFFYNQIPFNLKGHTQSHITSSGVYIHYYIFFTLTTHLYVFYVPYRRKMTHGHSI